MAKRNENEKIKGIVIETDLTDFQRMILDWVIRGLEKTGIKLSVIYPSDLLAKRKRDDDIVSQAVVNALYQVEAKVASEKFLIPEDFVPRTLELTELLEILSRILSEEYGRKKLNLKEKSQIKASLTKMGRGLEQNMVRNEISEELEFDVELVDKCVRNPANIFAMRRIGNKYAPLIWRAMVILCKETNE